MTGKSARLEKRVPAVGREAGPERVAFSFRGGDGRTKGLSFLEIADDHASRRRGLSKRASLSPIGGMFFDKAGAFWMRDTNFPLDLVFVDEYGKITEKMAMAVDPDGTKIYSPTKEAAHAIELPAGFCERRGIVEGDYVVPTKIAGHHRGSEAKEA